MDSGIVADNALAFSYTRAAAPLVGQSDLAFRLVCRRQGCDVTYTQMMLAGRYVQDIAYREGYHEVHPEDHPLVVQLAGDEPGAIVEAALIAQARGADAIDINLGCPQREAQAKHYGAWMTDPKDWDLCVSIVSALASCPELKIPVFAKIRLQQTVEQTIAFATKLQDAGCKLLVVHGRQRGSPEMRRAGAADLQAIAAVKAALRIPVISNGNIRCHADMHAALEITKADGVMSGEGLLRDPSILSCRGRACTSHASCSGCCVPADEAAVFPGPDVAYALILEYLELAEKYRPPTWATVLQHVSWMLGRTGHSGNVRYMLLDPSRRISGRALREELTCTDETGGKGGSPWDFDRLRRVVEAVVGPPISKNEARRRRKARKAADLLQQDGVDDDDTASAGPGEDAEAEEVQQGGFPPSTTT